MPLADEWYIVRPLTWKEHRELVELGQDDFESPDKIVDLALLHPESIDDVLAGVVDSLAGAIIELSGFGTMESFNSGVEWARGQVKLLEQQVMMVICSAFHYKPEELYQFSFLELMLRYGMAESMLGLAPPDEEVEPHRGRRMRRPPPGYQSQRMDGPPISSRMEAFGELPSHSAEQAMRGEAQPPDFSKDNAELNG